ncbi:N-methyl-L-tryptophan oxidase [Corynebacterium urogenitale]
MPASMIDSYDYVVIGCGTMGSMALWQLGQLAPAGSRILGIEKFGRVHTKGSYSGESRLFRLANKEGAHYVSLARQARALWGELNAAVSREVFIPTGAISIAPLEMPSMIGLRRVVDELGLEHTMFTAEELRERFPQFQIRDDDIGLFDPLGGAIRPEVAVASAQDLALRAGAELWDHTEVLDLTPIHGGQGETVSVATSKGTVLAKKVIVTAGSWAQTLLPGLKGLVEVTGVALNWFMPHRIENFVPEAMPVFIKDAFRADGSVCHVFGAPSLDGWSVKVSPLEQQRPSESVEAVTVTDAEVDAYTEDINEMMAGMLDSPVRTSLHHDGFTADGTPVIDVDSNGIVVAAGMSGRGMKFAPIYGKLIAELAVQGDSELQLPNFQLAAHLESASSGKQVVRL